MNSSLPSVLTLVSGSGYSSVLTSETSRGINGVVSQDIELVITIA
jgi:hypothetical protein